MNPRWMWAAGLAVAGAAAVATAHGSYEVARAAGVPLPVATLYPAIGDGLALVAYATTTRLHDSGRRYAWTVVTLAAGLSGIAQAAWLAGGVRSVPTSLRFGVGAWPAVAAAVVAHLLFLLAAAGRTAQSSTGVQACSTLNEPVERSPADEGDADPGTTVPTDSGVPTSAAERARVAALEHQIRQGGLPTVSELVEAAGVARGTAATALKALRHDPPGAQNTHCRTETSPSV